MKIVQLHPRERAAPHGDRASELGPEKGLSDPTESDAGAARPPTADETHDDESSLQSGTTDNVASPRQAVRKTVITIKRRKVRRPPTPSPVEILARSLDRSRLKTRRVTQKSPGTLQAPVSRPAPAPPVAPQSNSQRDDRTADGDQFWRVWLTHRDYLRSHALRFAGGNFADAEDALSEAMLKAAQTFESSLIHNHRAWLLRLVHNACMDRHRSDRRRSRLAKDITDTDAQTAPAVAIRPDRSPEELLCVLQQIGDLQRAMTALPSFLAEPFLRYLDDQSDAEIADSLNVTKEVIRKRRQIVRAMLRRCLSP